MKTTYLILIGLISANIMLGQIRPFDKLLVSKSSKIRIKARDLDSGFLLITASCNGRIALRDTIDNSGLQSIKYPDFNRDGYPDVLLSYTGNNNSYYLYLFDKKANKFRKVDDYGNFPDAIQLRSNSKYYYSYHRAGCADLNWVSDLFKLKNYQIVQIGEINGLGCDYNIRKRPKKIEIYKISEKGSAQWKLVAKLAYNRCIPDNGKKFDFISAYWNRNWKAFQ